MRNKFSILINLLFIAFSIVITSNVNAQEKKEVPAEYKAKENSHKGDKSLKIIGLRNFNRHCVSCHGKKGKGDGVMAKNMKTPPGDLTLKYIEEYTDGEVYYLSFIGEGDRPDLTKLVPTDEDKWAVVNYVRSLQAK